MDQRSKIRDQELFKEKTILQSNLEQLKQEKVIENEVRKEKDTKMKVQLFEI